MGTPQGDQILFAYGTVTLYGPNFHNGSAKHWFCNSLEGLLPFRAGPTTPLQHRQQAVPLQRFGLIPFRSPLLRKSLLLSFPRGTEMFQFPRFPPPGLCVQPGVTGHLPLPGFPIRRSTDRSLVGGSPWLIAATHVLHRHLAPRHPPLALCSLGVLDARARYAVLKRRLRRRTRQTTLHPKVSVDVARASRAATCVRPRCHDERHGRPPRKAGATPSKRKSDVRVPRGSVVPRAQKRRGVELSTVVAD